MARRIIPMQPSEERVEIAIRQAARERRKGHHRRSMLLLRTAAFEAERRPGLWTRYALACARGGKAEEAQKAFAHAVWLQERIGHARAAEVTRECACKVREGELPAAYDN